MGYQPPTTIADTLLRIQRGELVLPAIQREFVWRQDQVIRLFDSAMRGYPIGGFLSWKVEPKTVRKFRFYGFMKDYSGYNNRHNPSLDTPPDESVIALLDGQQRLTSLNIGLRGTYAYRTPGGWYNNPNAYPTRLLYLNLKSEAEPNEAGLRYDFRFLTDRQLAAVDEEDRKYWFPVQDAYATEEISDLWDLAGDAGLANHKVARRMLSQLWKAIHATPSIHFYEETDQDIERVLDIFIRVNSGGTVLSYSDLLLSIATAQWQDRDARSAIHGLVDELNTTGAGFNFSQDVILKSGLVLAGVSDFGFRVKNFTAENMATLDREWDEIGDSLKVAAGLLSDFGLSTATLSANSVLIPIAYYIHNRDLSQQYRVAVKEAADREKLRMWTLRTQIMPGIWGAGLDSLLRDLRQTITDHGKHSFPVAELERRMELRNKSLRVTDEQVESLLNLSYGGKQTFAVLAALFPTVDTRHLHHQDHVFPRSLLTQARLRKAGLDEALVQDLHSKRDLLPNLQLLEGSENASKSDTAPAKWAASRYAGQPDKLAAFMDRNHISTLPDGVDDFLVFYDERRTALRKLIRDTLGASERMVPEDAELVIGSIDDELAQSSFDD